MAAYEKVCTRQCKGAHAFILPDGRKLRFVQQSYSDNYSYYYFLAHISKAYLRLMDAR